MSDSQQLHCHHCQRWIGETSQALTFWGMFKDPRDRDRVDGQRDTWRCKSCGWANVFKPTTDYRAIELKAS